MIKGDVQKRGMLCFVVDALRRELRDVDDTTRSFDDFFFFLRRKEDRSNYLFIYLFFRLIFYFSLLNYLYMYMYMYFFFPPLFWKKRRFSFQSGEGRRLCTISSRCADASPVFSSFSVSINLSLSLFLFRSLHVHLSMLCFTLCFFLSLSLFSFYTHTHTQIYIYLCIRGAQLPTSCLCRSSEKGSGNVTSNSR